MRNYRLIFENQWGKIQKNFIEFANDTRRAFARKSDNGTNDACVFLCKKGGFYDKRTGEKAGNHRICSRFP